MNDIFTNQNEVAENINSSAEKLGVTASKLEPSPRKGFKAKNNCRLCWGQGIIVIESPSVIKGVRGKKDTYYCKCIKIKELK